LDGTQLVDLVLAEPGRAEPVQPNRERDGEGGGERERPRPIERGGQRTDPRKRCGETRADLNGIRIDHRAYQKASWKRDSDSRSAETRAHLCGIIDDVCARVVEFLTPPRWLLRRRRPPSARKRPVPLRPLLIRWSW